jgi:hypothetical protein
MPAMADAQRQQARRTAGALALLACAFYVAFFLKHFF